MSTAALFDAGTPMAARMQLHAWEATPIGPPEAWPAALRGAVRALLATHEPRSISWGPSLCLLYNDAYAALMDDRHPAALGRPLPEVWAEVWDELRPDVESALAGRATFRGLVPLQREFDGVSSQHWHTVAYSPLYDDDGRVGGVQCLSVNMTDRVVDELVRERELQSLRRLFDEAPGFMAVLRGPDYTYELVNRAFETLVGRRGLVGHSLRRALPRIDGRGYVELLDEVRRTGRAFVGRALPAQVLDADGALAERYIDVVFQPILDVADEATRIFVQGADVTDREHALRALREEAREKDRFFAMLAHELRNPLAPIAHAAAALRTGELDPARGRQLGEVIHRQAAQLARIVDDLVDIARASRGSLHLACATLDLRGVVQAAVEEVAPLVERKRHRLDTRMPALAVPVWGDGARLTQVVANLLGNAARYTPDGGTLAVELAIDGSEAVLTVRDDGIGIDAQMLPRVFELFVQANSSTTRREGGLGVGLALVRHLVELHGGRVLATSEGEGCGACFTVRLSVHARDLDAPGVPSLGNVPTARPLH